MDPDSRLVDEARAGDRRAYELLVERHRNTVFRFGARIVGFDDADDVAQDVFVRAYYRLDQFAGRGNFRAWILQITRTVALNALTRRKPEDAEEQELTAQEPARGPARTLESKERRERLESKVRLLAPNHRAVLVLRDIEGLSYDEIAEVAEMPVGSVKGRLHRARAELIDLLRRNTYDWELPAGE